ncbi:MAG: hypothetical protein ACR2NM_02165 [Bythopirellula sp.]
MSTTEPNAYEADSADVVGYDADEWGQYRSLSTLSVIAFVLGLCSVVTFASPLLLLLPLAAASAALLALRGIAASQGSLSGATLARWGLGLAIVFGVASFARVHVRDLIMRQQAERVARQWLALAADGQAETMMDLMSRAAVEKVSPSEQTSQPAPSFFGGMLASALMRQDPLVVGLAELGESGEIRFRLADSQMFAAGSPPQAFLRYSAASNDSEQRTCALELKRFRATEAKQIWLVDGWELD